MQQVFHGLIFKTHLFLVGRFFVGRFFVGRFFVGRFFVGRFFVGRFFVGRFFCGIANRTVDGQFTDGSLTGFTAKRLGIQQRANVEPVTGQQQEALTADWASSILLAVGASGSGGCGGMGGGGGSTSFPTVGTHVPLDDSRSKHNTCKATEVVSVEPEAFAEGLPPKCFLQCRKTSVRAHAAANLCTTSTDACNSQRWVIHHCYLRDRRKLHRTCGQEPGRE